MSAIRTRRQWLLYRAQTHITQRLRTIEEHDGTARTMDELLRHLKNWIHAARLPRSSLIHGGAPDSIDPYLISRYYIEPLVTPSERLHRIVKAAWCKNHRDDCDMPISEFQNRMAQLAVHLSEEWSQRCKKLVHKRIQQFLQALPQSVIQDSSSHSTVHQLETIRDLQQDVLMLQQLTEDLLYLTDQMSIELHGITSRAHWRTGLEDEDHKQHSSSSSNSRSRSSNLSYVGLVESYHDEFEVPGVLLEQWQYRLDELHDLLSGLRYLLQQRRRHYIQTHHTAVHTVR